MGPDIEDCAEIADGLLVGSTTESERSGGEVGAIAVLWCIVPSTEL